MGDLKAAVAQALHEGRREFERLKPRVLRALQVLDAVRVRLQSWLAEQGPSQSPTPPIAPHRLRRLLVDIEQCQLRIEKLLAQQEAALSSFNLALFGQTGTGKSSTQEALTHGDGSTVSSGRTDYTTKVSYREYAACRVYDMPGIEGLGLECPSEELQTLTREAVEWADIVLLMFDETSQQARVFRKIAEYIQKYGKPVVALLNVRDLDWRLPDSSLSAAQRLQKCQTLREQTDYVQAELGKIGLDGVVVVALHAQRAMFGRIEGPYRGPPLFASMFRRLHAEYGAEGLVDSSNLLALEDLLAALLSTHALDLRLGMLRDEVRSFFSQVQAELTRVRDAALDAARKEEMRIAAALHLLGDSLRQVGIPAEYIRELEQLRGTPLSGPEIGEVETFLEKRMRTRLGHAERQTRERAIRAIRSAFDERRSLSKADLAEAALPDPIALQKLAASLVRDAATQLAGKLHLFPPELPAELPLRPWNLPDVEGTASERLRFVGDAAQYLGLAVRALTLKTDTPDDAIIADLSAWGLGKGGRYARSQAEAQGIDARSVALALTCEEIRAVFADLHEQVHAQVKALGQTWGAQARHEPLRRAVRCRQMAEAAEQAGQGLEALGRELPARRPAQQLIAEAQRREERRRYPGDPAASRKLWLGELWIDEASAPSELVTQSVAPQATPLPAAQAAALKALFAGVGASLTPGSGSAWLKNARHLLSGDAQAHGMLRTLMSLAEENGLWTGLAGDVDAGKSACIKRLHLSQSIPVPKRLAVRTGPTTEEAARYPLGNLALLDVPGAQSGRPEHEARALAALPSASFLVVLVLPRLWTGETAMLDTFLRGNRERGLLSKLSRTLFVITHLDETGLDPEQDADAYAALCQGKRAELLQALHRHGIPARLEQILCVAMDPHRTVGNRLDVTAADYAAFAAWDGFAAFSTALDLAAEALFPIGRDLLLLETGLYQLVRLRDTASLRQQDLERRIKSLDRALAAHAEAQTDGEVLRKSIVAGAKDLIDRHLHALAEQVLAAKTDEDLAALEPRLKAWHQDAWFEQQRKEWESQAHRDVRSWQKRAYRAMGKTRPATTSRPAPLKFRTTVILPDLGPLEDPWRLAAGVVHGTGILLRGATRKSAMAVAHGADIKFAPHGAKKFTKSLNDAGVAAGVAGMVVEVQAMRLAAQQERRREALRGKVVRAVRKSEDDVLQQLTASGANGTGPLGAFAASQQDLADAAAELQRRKQVFQKEHAQLAEDIARYTSLVEQAQAALGPMFSFPKESA